MIEEQIPGFGPLSMQHLVLDLNGTLTVGGRWLDGVPERIERLAEVLSVHVLTADTYGVARELTRGLPLGLTVLAAGGEDRQKAEYVARLGPEGCVAVGNGRNDVGMLSLARLAIVVIEAEGCAAAALRVADVVCRSGPEALDLLLCPERLRATLRS
jgi:soluble P-type ATPase